MRVKILFDSEALDNKFSTGWGVSYLIGTKILFDTGGNSDFLLRNMKNMGVEASDLESVVISHDHLDHIGGLWGLLKENPKVKVFICPNFSKGFKNKIESYGNLLIEVDRFTKISENIHPIRDIQYSSEASKISNGVYTTGELPGRYVFMYMPEQSLVLKTQNGLIILTGCAHPGIIKIIENAKQNISGDIYLVLGGFHLAGKSEGSIKEIINNFKQLHIKKVAPTHCTGEVAIALFKEEYRDDFIELKVGQTIEV